MKPSFLLINAGNESDWPVILREALDALGQLFITSEVEASAEILHKRYDLVIIDAATVQKPVELVSQLHARDTSIRIIVAAVTPTWQEARTVLRAGAADYVRRPSNKEELISMIQNAVDLSASSQGD
jgi:DNA-binding NtrC family response regulator